MKFLQKAKKPVAVMFLSCALLQFSAQNAVAIGAYHNTRQETNSAIMQDELAVGAMAIAAGVGIIAAAMKATYDVGVMVGHLAHDLFGAQQEELAFATYEKQQYAADDFSQFDNSSVN